MMRVKYFYNIFQKLETDEVKSMSIPLFSIQKNLKQTPLNILFSIVTWRIIDNRFNAKPFLTCDMLEYKFFQKQKTKMLKIIIKAK